MKLLNKKTIINYIFKYACLGGAVYGLYIYFFKHLDSTQTAYYLFIAIVLYGLSIYFKRKIEEEDLIFHKNNVKVSDEDKKGDVCVTFEDGSWLNLDRMIRIQESFEFIEFMALKSGKLSVENYKRITKIREADVNELIQVKENKLDYETYVQNFNVICDNIEFIR